LTISVAHRKLGDVSQGVTATAVEQLGWWRWAVRGELRALPTVLEPQERVECMVAGSITWSTGELLVATDRRLLLVRNAWWRSMRCGAIAYHDIDELRVSHRRFGPELALVSAHETRRLSPYEPEWVDRVTSVLMTRSACARVSETPGNAVIDGGYGSLGWGAPVSARLTLWVNALLSGLFGVGFLWSALYWMLGGTRSDPSVLGIDFAGMSTDFDPGDFAMDMAMGILFVGFAVFLVWIGRRGSDRVIADPDGVALRTRNRARYPWSDIDRFEVGTLLDEDLVQMEEVDGHCAVMVLRTGDRIALMSRTARIPQLRRWEFPTLWAAGEGWA
jgi:hypothetical protein